MGAFFVMTEFIKKAFKEDERKAYYFTLYTLLFGIVAFLCFSWFIFNGKSMIFTGDGNRQHLNALVYYSQYLRTIFSNLVHGHSPIVPEWDFYIGEGSDVVSTFNYYAIGDPIALFSVFVPVAKMHIFYTASTIFRLYMAGIAFSALCFGTGRKNRFAIMAGTIGYCFCSWSLLNAARHIFFLNPMIWLPLIILGVEKIIGRKRPYLFIISVALASASSFYFFYMLVIITFIYTVLRLGFLYKKEIKKILMDILKVGIYSLMGVCISGILVLPVLMEFVNDSRSDVSIPMYILYPMKYYAQIPSALITGERTSYWLCIGMTAPVIMAIALLFINKKEDIFLKVLFVVGCFLILIPLFGRVFNGMSYISNRWSWAFICLCMYVLVKKWEIINNLTRKQWITLAGVGVGYSVICFFFLASRSISAFASLIIFFIALGVVRDDNSEEYKARRQQALLLFVAIVGVINIAFWMYSPNNDDYISQCVDAGHELDDIYMNEDIQVADGSEFEYTRMTGRGMTQNVSMFSDVSSTQYYWTLSSPYINQFRSSMAMREQSYHHRDGYDERTVLNELAGVNYFVMKEYDYGCVPYGYSFVRLTDNSEKNVELIADLKDELGVDELTEGQEARLLKDPGNYRIYKNDYALPITYCYDSYITEKKWNMYDPIQKQEVMMDAAYINTEEGRPEGIEEIDHRPNEYRVNYEEVMNSDDIVRTVDGVITTSPNTQMTLALGHEVVGSELYVRFSNLEFYPTTEYDLYTDNEVADPLNLYNKTNWKQLSESKRNKLRMDRLFCYPSDETNITVEANYMFKNIEYLPSDLAFSSGRHDFVVNIGYFEDPACSIMINFSKRGVYTFDDVQVYSVPMNEYPAKVEKLQQDHMTNLKIGDDEVTGDISLDKQKLMCLAMTYSDGWDAYVDGNATKVYRLNEKYMGIVVPAGDHKIVFRYTMPYKWAGCIITLCGILVFIVMIVVVERRRKVGTR